MENKNFYVTTPIYYVNGEAHLGHLYSTVIGDVLARYSRLKGDNTFFLTGTDEHGQKVEEAAKLYKKEPQIYCDEISKKWKELWDSFNISYDRFIRTTEEEHKNIVKCVFKKMFDKGDIELSKYQGYYCISCEDYIVERNLNENKSCPHCNRETIFRDNEPSYIFKLSNYKKKLLDYYDDHPDFILPKSKKSEVVNFIDNLDDLHISRSSFTWGIEVPESVIDNPNSGEKHIIYVWLDALFNYYSGISDQKNIKFWPPDYHIIGKDILKFHAVYWLAFLMSMDYKLPKHIATHGWWTRNAEKMSKSKGNVLNPTEVVKIYGLENFKYFMLREVPFGNDGDFSEASLRERINTDLANGYGNLLSRIYGLAFKYLDSCIDSSCIENDSSFREYLNTLSSEVETKYEELNFDKLLQKLWEYLKESNTLLQNLVDNKAEDKKNEAQTILAKVANILGRVSILLHPIMPEATKKVAKNLGFSIDKDNYNYLITKNNFLKKFKFEKKPEVLFSKFDKDILHPPRIAPVRDNLVNIAQFELLTLKVGKVVEAYEIPQNESSLRLMVDIGNDITLQIIANIKKYYDVSSIKDKLVSVVTNLELKKINGLDSEGMILMAIEKKKMSIISPVGKDIKIGSIIR